MFQYLLLFGLAIVFLSIVRLVHEAVRQLKEIRLHVKMTREITHEFHRLMYDTLVDVENGFKEAKLYKLVRDKNSFMRVSTGVAEGFYGT
jgi:hypothetical protein